MSLQALGTLGHTNALPAIMSRLSHPSPNIRHAAVTALGSIKDPKTLSVLMERFEQEQDLRVRCRIVSSISELKNDEAIPFLVSVLAITRRSEDDSYWFNAMRSSAVYGLADLNAENALPALAHALDANSNEGSMVNALVKALGRIGTEDARLSRLFKLLTHSSSYVRGQAATTLGYIGAAIQDLKARDRLVQELINILYDTGHALHYAVPLVGDAVAKSLYFIGTPEAETASKEWNAKRASILANLRTGKTDLPNT
jgi:HEAT repeat protein